MHFVWSLLFSGKNSVTFCIVVLQYVLNDIAIFT